MGSPQDNQKGERERERVHLYRKLCSLWHIHITAIKRDPVLKASVSDLNL